VTGKDRAKFLHNFCTNNIKAMTAGHVLEAFFVNVQAKVLAHGYVAAFESHHEIWMLPGDPSALVKHLSRYVISEDVQVELAGGVTKAFSCSGQQSRDPYSATFVEPGCGTHINGKSETHAIWVMWASEAIMIVGGSTEAVTAAEKIIVPMNRPIDASQFQQLRIEERYPIVGIDMTSDHLAPEADRNAVAISYTKGCYLGQEPIARIDALGHVNKSLKRVRLRPESGHLSGGESLIGGKLRTSDEQSDDRNVVGTVTSAVENGGEVIGLSIVRLSAAKQTLRLLASDGQIWLAEC
jgi:folate-binding protein YgfZ